MKFHVKSPYGISYEYDLEQIRTAFKEGSLPEKSKVRQHGAQEWQTLLTFLEGADDLTSLPVDQLAASEHASRRYSDAYTTAGVIITLGTTIKTLSYGVAALAVIVGFFAAASERSGGIFFAALFFGCICGIPIYVLGVLVSTQGQILLATLDTAVNSSRHLTDHDVAQILNNRNA